MKPETLALWEKQDQHKGDRWRLFQAVGAAIPASAVLYAGSYVDIAPSFVYDNVTYVDMDKRAARFFADEAGVKAIIERHGGPTEAQFQFIHADYRELDLDAQRFDLLISLYAGFISEACGHLLRIGGTLLVNPSHADAALAAADPRFTLIGVVESSNGEYRITKRDLDRYMIPKKPQDLSRDSIKARGRGIGYTRSPFAYLFKRIS